MYQSAYELVVSGMRYVFLALILYILIRLVQHSVTEFRAVQEIKHKVRSVSPGYLEVVSPEAYQGEKYPLKRENTIGRSKRCDICVDIAGLAPIHAFLFEKKKGLYIASYGSRNVIFINGETIKGQEELLYTQDLLEMGTLLCKLHLAGEAAQDDEPVNLDEWKRQEDA